MKKVVINSSGGGTDKGISGNGITESDITLKISNIIKEKLEKNGIEVLMLRDKDETISYDNRIKLLNNTYPDPKDVILISNTLNTSPGIDIIYPLKKTDELASSISKNLNYFNDTKYYQYRWPTDTTKDYFYLTRNTPDYETIIIRYGTPNNNKDLGILKNNYKELAESVADTLINYINPNNNIYVVKKGDTLYSIANKYNVSVQNLKDINNLSNDKISISQELLIPQSTNNLKNIYIVSYGDTLYSIAKKYNTTVDKLKLLNNKTNNLISIGEELIITELNEYTIKSGDTLYSLANKFNTTVDKIKEINNLKNNNLIIGNILYIP